jgi:molybdopterin synthase catalytic subunit
MPFCWPGVCRRPQSETDINNVLSNPLDQSQTRQTTILFQHQYKTKQRPFRTMTAAAAVVVVVTNDMDHQDEDDEVNNDDVIVNNEQQQPAAEQQDQRFLVVVAERDHLPTFNDCYNFVAQDNPSCGAVATFVGITRDHFDDRKVIRLQYEGYVPMAIRVLRQLLHEAIDMQHYPSVQKIAVCHILGDCPVGQSSVIIACAAPHRRDALRCCEYLIDELKARVPIWKLEVYQGDDTSVWKENVEWHDGQRRRVMVRQTNAKTATPTTTAADGSSTATTATTADGSSTTTTTTRII